MGYLSCRADSSIASCRSISDLAAQPQPSRKDAVPDDEGGGGGDPPAPRRRIRRFTYHELESATNNFSDSSLLGRGSHGAVYKAILHGTPVAVKRPSHHHHHHRGNLSNSDFINELTILSRIHSPRLVNLIGSTTPPPPLNNNNNPPNLLVVEFMPNGTLYDLLHTRPRPPSWSRRLRLALQTSLALLALHSASPPVIHRDVKSANILLDARLNARLADFGLALSLSPTFPSSTPPAGTLGYLDPSYVTPETLSTKTDVFSFGILLFEIITGRKAIDVAHSPPSVVDWALPLLRKRKFSLLFDPRIPPPRHPAALAALAASCVRSSKDRRPSMEEIADQLKLLCKTVPPARTSWNALAISNPCSVVDTERTLPRRHTNSRRNFRGDPPMCSVVQEEETGTADEEAQLPPSSSLKSLQPLRNGSRVFSSDASARGDGSTNLKDLMARLDHDPIGVLGQRSSSISRTRSLRDHYNRDGMRRLWRNQSTKGASFDPVLRLDEVKNRQESKIPDQVGDDDDAL